MDRREFLKKSLALGIGAGFSMLPGSQLLANETSTSLPDLVAIKGGKAEDMFEKGIKTLGGMEKFVKKGDKVVIKPNIGWATSPERGGNTNPELVKKVIEHCYKAGAKKVYVFDNSCDTWKACYKNSGIEKAAKEAKAIVVPNEKSMYKEVVVPGAKFLKKTDVHELVIESDVFINIPILKDHMATRLSISIKNLMGVVWDRGYYHSSDLDHCIADFLGFRKPDLNIIDAYRVMTKNGPRGVSEADIVKLKTQIISTDIVAADTAAAKIFGVKPEKVRHLKIAADRGFGNMNLKELKIKKIVL